MTVKELIEKLKSYPQDYKICFWYYDTLEEEFIPSEIKNLYVCNDDKEVIVEE